MGALFLALVAGLVTILNPCVLPLVPILVVSALGQSRWGPLALSAGLVASFSSLGLLVVAFGLQLGIDENLLRMLAGGLLLLAGAILLLPRAQMALSAAAAPLANRANALLGRVDRRGAAGQFLVGALLGLVWVPCVGPTLGVAIAAASRGEDLATAFLTFLAFGLGVAASILLFAYGSRKALGEVSRRLRWFSRYGRPTFGAALIVVGLLVTTGWDKYLEAALLERLPQGLVVFTTRF